MTETLDVPRVQTTCPRCAETVDPAAVSCPHCGSGLQAEAPSAAPARFTLGKAQLGSRILGPLSRNGIFTSTIQLTLEGGKLTMAGTYVGRKTAARAFVTRAVYVGALVVFFFLLWQVLILPVAIGIAIPLALFVTLPLDRMRHHHPVTLERAAADVTVKKVKGRRIELRGPFEVERPNERIKLIAYARTKEDAAALAEMLARKGSSATS
jgi:hypothetical protein